MRLVAKIQKNRVFLLVEQPHQHLLLSPYADCQVDLEIKGRRFKQFQISKEQLLAISKDTGLLAVTKDIEVLGFSTHLEITLQQELLHLLRLIFKSVESPSVKPSIASLKSSLQIGQYHAFRQTDLVSIDCLDFIGPVEPQPAEQPSFPYLFVSTRSGGLFMLVTSNTEHVRMTGSIIGQLSFRNILSGMINVHDFTKYVAAALESGVAARADLLVKDIYGDSAIKIGLPQNLVASSLAKLSRPQAQKANTLDIIKSLAISLAINFAQLASYSAIIAQAKGIVIASEIFDQPRWQLAVASLVYIHCKLPVVFPRHAKRLVQLGYIIDQE